MGIFLSANSICAEIAEDPWPMFQYNASRTGKSSYAGPGFNNNIEAGVFIDGGDKAIFNVPVVDSSGVIYFTAKINNQTGLYAFYPDGTQKWYYPTSLNLSGSPIVAPNKGIFFYSTDNTTKEASLLMFDYNGNIIWQQKIINEFYPVGYPIAVNNRIYFLANSFDGNFIKLVVLNSDTGDIVWQFEKEGRFIQSVFSLAVGADGTAYFGYKNNLYSVSSEGVEKWHRVFVSKCKYYTCEPEVGIPSIVDNSIIYVIVNGESDWRNLTDEGTSNHLHAIDIENPMSDKWEKVLKTWRPSQSIDSKGNIYIVNWSYTPSGGGFSRMVAFTPEGYKLFEQKFDAYGNPSYLLIDSEDNIYVLLRSYPSSRLYIFNQLGEKKLIDFNFSYAGEFISLGADKSLYINSPVTGGKFYKAGIANEPPSCSIELRKKDTLDSTDKVGVGEFFDIYVGDSTDDSGIKEVRFSSDDSQNNNPEGEWTSWYNWNNSSGDWDAQAKIKDWMFATSGDKEVWVEIKDVGGKSSRCFKNIEVPEQKVINVAVILAEPNDVSHITGSVTERPCKLLPERTYPNGYNKDYYQDLAYCVNDYHKENSFDRINLKFTIYDNDGEWFKTSKNENDYYLSSKKREGKGEQEFVIDAINLAINKGIDISSKDIVIVIHSGTSGQRTENKLITETWSLTGHPLGYPPYKIIVAEDDPIGAWCHEIGHIIGALITPENTITPDIYKMGDVKEWDLMAEGSWNGGLLNIKGTDPPYMSSYLKEFLGWLKYDIYPKSAYGEYWINSLETSEFGDSVFRYNLTDDINDESSKYYILEVRNRNLKTWDSSTPGLPLIGDKNMILYYVDTKGLQEYGYISDDFSDYPKGMMWNQYRYITIPGSGSINDGVLSPLINETYRDLDNLVKFSAITDRSINNKYEIQAKIEEITKESFSDKFWGVILRPSSLFRNIIKQETIQNSDFSNPCLTKKTYIIGTIDEIQPAPSVMYGSEGWLEPVPPDYFIYKIKSSTGEINEILVKNSTNTRYSFRVGDRVIIFAELGPDCWLWSRIIYRVNDVIIYSLIIFFAGIIAIWLLVKNIRSEELKKSLKILSLVILIVIIASLIFFILVCFSIIPRIIVDGKNLISNFSNSSLSTITLPDIDLHLYCDDGRHIGINYETGEYENQIPEAIISGDNQDSPEWIFIPKDIANCHYVVSSYDNQKFLEENPDIADQISDTKDSYEVYARYIDPQSGIYDSNVILEDIKPNEELEQPVTGTTDIKVSSAVPFKELVAYYSFENNIDDQTENNSATSYGGSYVDGKVGRALRFDGINDYVKVDYNSLFYSDTMTISFWAKSDKSDYAVNSYPISMWDYAANKRMWAVYIPASTDKWSVFVSDNGSNTESKTLNMKVDDKWHKFDIIADNNLKTWEFYIDGAFSSKLTFNNSYIDKKSNLTIGGLKGSNYFSGIIDELKIWNYKLSPDEILKEYERVKEYKKDTIAVYDSFKSVFYLKNDNSCGYADITFGYGAPNTNLISLRGDWNNDGIDTIGVYSRKSSTFMLRNSNNAGFADITFNYGPSNADLIPLSGDWNNDGVDTIGVYDPKSSTFMLKNSNSAGSADMMFNYGPSNTELIPIIGDWNNDGIDTIGVYDPVKSVFYLKNNNSFGPADITFNYGAPNTGLMPVIGDWDNDGNDTIGVYSPKTSTFMLKNSNSAGSADITFNYGWAGSLKPVIGNWDGCIICLK